MIKNVKEYDRFISLVREADEVIKGPDEDSTKNRESILAAMKLSKLMVAEERSKESLALYLDLSTKPEVILEALSKASGDISNLDSLLAYNNEIYFRVIKYISENKLES